MLLQSGRVNNNVGDHARTLYVKFPVVVNVVFVPASTGSGFAVSVMVNGFTAIFTEAVSIHPFGEVATARYTVLSNGVAVTTFPGPTPGQSIVFPGEVAVSVISCSLTDISCRAGSGNCRFRKNGNYYWLYIG